MTIFCSSMPWYCISRKKLFGPRMSRSRAGRLERRTRLLHLQRARHLALQAAAQADESLRMLGQQFLVDARPVVEPFGVAGRHQLDQVLVALVGLGEQDQVIRLGLRARSSRTGFPARRRPRSPRIGLSPRSRA